MLRPFILTARLPAPPRHAVDRYLDGSILSSLTTKSRSTCAFSCFAIAWSERGWGDVRRKAFGSALFPGAIPADSSLLLLSGYCLRRGGRRKRLPGPLNLGSRDYWLVEQYCHREVQPYFTTRTGSEHWKDVISQLFTK